MEHAGVIHERTVQRLAQSEAAQQGPLPAVDRGRSAGYVDAIDQQLDVVFKVLSVDETMSQHRQRTRLSCPR